MKLRHASHLFLCVPSCGEVRYAAEPLPTGNALTPRNLEFTESPQMSNSHSHKQKHKQDPNVRGNSDSKLLQLQQTPAI